MTTTTPMLTPDVLAMLLEACEPMRASAQRQLDLPDEIWAKIDEGAVALSHPRLGAMVWTSRDLAEEPALLWPRSGTPAWTGLCQSIAQEIATARSASAVGARKLEWTAVWPSKPGYYWVYGYRPQDQRNEPPVLAVAVLEEYARHDRETNTTQTLLQLSSDGIAMRPDGTRAVFARLHPPATIDLPKRQLAAVPEPPPPSPLDSVHCVWGGTVLCGLDPGQLGNRPTARISDLAGITCPICRMAAESHRGQATGAGHNVSAEGVSGGSTMTDTHPGAKPASSPVGAR